MLCCITSLFLHQAVTLPASFYTNPAALQLEKQHVLYNTWQVGAGALITACAKAWGAAGWISLVLDRYLPCVHAEAACSSLKTERRRG